MEKQISKSKNIIAWIFKIVGGLNFIGGLLAFGFGILIFSSYNPLMSEVFNEISSMSFYFIFLITFFGEKTFFILLGILSICLGILLYLVGRGLHRGKYWARITAIVILILQVILFLIPFTFSSLFNLIVSGIMIYYLVKN